MEDHTKKLNRAHRTNARLVETPDNLVNHRMMRIFTRMIQYNHFYWVRRLEFML